MSKSAKKSQKSLKSRKNKTKKSIKYEESYDEKADNILNELKEIYSKEKSLMNEFRELTKVHKKEIRLSSRSSSRSNSGKHTGFNKPEPIPPSLKKLLKIKEDLLPRSKITSLMYRYFTDNKMYDKKSKQQIIPNDKIRKIFKMKENDTITFFNLQTWLKKVYNINSGTDNTLKIED